MVTGDCDSELCLKNLNQLASISLVEMDEDCFLLKPAGFVHVLRTISPVSGFVIFGFILCGLSNYAL